MNLGGGICGVNPWVYLDFEMNLEKAIVESIYLIFEPLIFLVEFGSNRKTFDQKLTRSKTQLDFQNG